MVNLESATEEYLWHSQCIGGVGGLEVGPLTEMAVDRIVEPVDQDFEIQALR